MGRLARCAAWTCWGLAIHLAPGLLRGLAPLEGLLVCSFSSSEAIAAFVAVAALGLPRPNRRQYLALWVAETVCTALYLVSFRLLFPETPDAAALLWIAKNAAWALWAALGPLWAFCDDKRTPPPGEKTSEKARPALAAARPTVLSSAALTALYVCSALYELLQIDRALGLLGAVASLATVGVLAALSIWVRPRTGEAQGEPSPLGHLDPPPGTRLDLLEALSERERVVVVGLLNNRSQAQIAADLGLKPSTVSTYKHRACEKLGIKGVDELVEAGKADPARPGAPAQMSSDLRGVALDLAPALLAAPYAALLGAPFFVAPFALAQRAALALCLAAAVPGSLCALRRTRSAPSAAAAPWANTLDLTLKASAALTLRGVATGRVPVLLACLPALCTGLFLLRARRRPRTDGPPYERAREGTLCGDLAFVLALCAGLSFSPAQTLAPGAFPAWDLSALYALGAVAVLLATVLTLLRARSLPRARPDKLGPRHLSYLRGRGLGELEAQTALLIAQGRPAAEICERLCIAPATVDVHRLRAYRRLRIHSREQLRELLRRECG